MIQSKGISPYFWAEPINYAKNIVKYTPTKD